MFDDIARSDLEYAKDSEKGFGYLNRSARKEIQRLREIIEEWFDRYPECQAKRDLRNRFRKNIEPHHQGAFFELYLHELLLSEGYKLEIHPILESEGPVPDFRVYVNGKPAFYLEAKLLWKSDSERAGDSRLYAIFDALNGIYSPDFLFWVNYSGAPRMTPDCSPIRKVFAKELLRLDANDYYDEYRSGNLDILPYWKWDFLGCKIEVQLIPKSPNERGKKNKRNIGASIGDAFLIHAGENILKAVSAKRASRYANLDLPYIIALNYSEKWGLDDEEVLNAIFGKQQVTLFMNKGNVIDQKLSRASIGAFFVKDRPRNQGVSALLIADKVRSDNFESRTPKLWHNPYAKYPIQPNLFSLPQMIPDYEKGCLEYKEGVDIRVILKI